MFRPILRTANPVLRATTRRTFADAAEHASAGNAGAEFIKQREAIRHHAAKSGELWRKITYYVAFPCRYFNAKSLMNEHQEHLEHIKHENGGELPERVVYPYFNIRTKEFPWGNHTLFYNPHVNIDPDATAEE